MKPSQSEFLQVRGLRYHIRHWGAPDAPMLFAVHGWMDVSASFQFMVDCLRRERHVIALDWRGFGLSERAHADSYWFPDYLGDLDAVLRHYAPGQPVDLLGHSMGGNVAALYAGIRPQQVRKLINLEGFGLPVTRPEQAPQRYAQWLDELHEPPGMRPYASRRQVLERLRKNNPRLTPPRAEFLADHWAAQNAQGEWEILGDPAHKVVNPVLYRVEEAMACWQAIEAPVLWVEGSESSNWRWMGDAEAARAEVERRVTFIPRLRREAIQGAGHMLHHDQPEALAALVESFLS